MASPFRRESSRRRASSRKSPNSNTWVEAVLTVFHIFSENFRRI
jgi:hypothetical protein